MNDVNLEINDIMEEYDRMLSDSNKKIIILKTTISTINKNNKEVVKELEDVKRENEELRRMLGEYSLENSKLKNLVEQLEEEMVLEEPNSEDIS